MDLFSERLTRLIDLLDIKNANEFGKMLGYSSSEKISRLVRNKENKPSFDILSDILETFPDINGNWLITGKGSPTQNERYNFSELKTGSKTVSNAVSKSSSAQNERYNFFNQSNRVTIVPHKAVAGYLEGYSEQKFLDSLPDFSLPNLPNGDYTAFEVSGYSMYNTFYPGDYIICEIEEDWSNIQNDRVYVINSALGIIIKRVLNRLEVNGHLILQSDNYADNKFPDMVLEKEEIIEVWHAKAFISQHMPGNKYLYSMIHDLKGRIVDLEIKVNSER